MQSAQSEEKVAPAPSMDIDAADDDDKQLLQDDGEARYRFDAKTFLTYFLYIILFPFSELFRCIFFRRRRDFALASNVSIFMVVYWVYVILYIVLQHKEFTLTEMAIPALLLLLIATDSATALSNPSLTVKIMAMTELYFKYRRAHLNVKTAAIGELVMVTPMDETTRKKRDRMEQFKITLPVDTPPDRIRRFALLHYDRDQTEEMLRAQLASSGAGAAEKLLAGSQYPGESYKKQVLEHPKAVSLGAVADQIIWGISPRRFGCAAFTTRFFTFDKIAMFAFGVCYVGLTAALPTINRSRENTLDNMNAADWIMAIFYIILTVVLTVQVIIFFMLIGDVYAKEYQRLALLTTLFSPEASTAACLPSLNLQKPDHIIAWRLLRNHVATFSAPSQQFYGLRLVYFTITLLASVFYLLGAYLENTLQDSRIFSMWTILTFVVFLAYFFVIIGFGILANGEMIEQRRRCIRESMDMLEADFLARVDARNADKSPEAVAARKDAIKRRNYAQQLFMVLYHHLEALPMVSLLGLSLDSGLVGLIMTGLATVAGSVIPILLSALGLA